MACRGLPQVANGLTTYVNAIHPLAGLYDGFLLHSQTAAPMAPHAGSGGAAPAGAAIRSDATSRVVAVQDEWTIAVAGAWLNRQPDSASFRLWEVAGTGHVDRDMMFGTAEAVQRDLGIPPPSCARPANELPLRWVVGAALRRLEEWVAFEAPPPGAPWLDLEGSSLIRDAFGNATGGVRLPHLDVPTATHVGVGNGGPGPCAVSGISNPIDAAAMSALYGSDGALVSRFSQRLDSQRHAGFVLDFDAAEARSQSGTSISGSP
jgi:hypothetical protein